MHDRREWRARVILEARTFRSARAGGGGGLTLLFSHDRSAYGSRYSAGKTLRALPDAHSPNALFERRPKNGCQLGIPRSRPQPNESPASPLSIGYSLAF